MMVWMVIAPTSMSVLQILVTSTPTASTTKVLVLKEHTQLSEYIFCGKYFPKIVNVPMQIWLYFFDGSRLIWLDEIFTHAYS